MVAVIVWYLTVCRMTAYFNKVGWPEKAPKSEDERKTFIAGLHKRKTDLFMALIEKQLLPLRPGVAKSVTLLTPLSFMHTVILMQLVIYVIGMGMQNHEENALKKKFCHLGLKYNGLT